MDFTPLPDYILRMWLIRNVSRRGFMELKEPQFFQIAVVTHSRFQRLVRLSYTQARTVIHGDRSQYVAAEH